MEEKQDMEEGHRELSEDDFIRTLRILTVTALNGDDPLIRKHAVYMIGIARNPACIPVLIRALKDPEKEVRSQATQELAMMGEPACSDLIGLLQDPDWIVRYRASEALGMMGDEKAAPPLIRMLSDPKDHVRYMAAKSLGMLGTSAAREPLRRCLGDENSWVRAMVYSALSKIGN
jgi:HEAT repeat protein